MACDPAAVILFRTSGKPGLSVKAYVHKDFLPYRNNSKEEKVLISVSSDQAKHDTLFFYGLGMWPEERVKVMAGLVDSIVIQRPSGTQRFTDSCAIEKFLLHHRRGVLNQRIEITVKK